MVDFQEAQYMDLSEGGVISTLTSLVGVMGGTAPASTAWPAANTAIFVPMLVAQPLTVYKLAIGSGAVSAGNFDVGIYDRFGNLIVSSGATAKATSAEIIADITDTRLGPGLYYMALAADDTDNYFMITPSGTSPIPLQKARLCGTLQMASAYTLPNPATMVARTTAVIPMIAAYTRGH